MAFQNKRQRMEISEIESIEWIIRLPDFILGKIFSFLDNKSKFKVALTCSHFNSIVKSDPEVYKTFKLTYNPEKNGKFDIPEWTRPVPTVIFDKVNMTHEATKEFIDGILRFFRSVGKFVKSFECREISASQENLFHILNEIPNAESFDFNGDIKDAPVEDFKILDSFEVKHQFKNLKTLHLRSEENISTDILDRFFGNATNISSLGLCEYLNLLYNKPKLEKVQLYLGNDKIIMRESSADNKIYGNVKELNLIIFHNFSWRSYRFAREIENLGKFIKSQNEIVKFFATPREDADFLSDIFQHVLGLKSLRNYTINVPNDNADDNGIFFRNSPYLEVLDIRDANPSDFVPFFPNLKYLQVSRSGYEYTSSDYEAINQLKLLEELYIQLAPGYEILDLQNLKKLVIFTPGNTETLNNFAESFLKNHPNIVDFAWHPYIELNDESNKQLANLLKSLKSLKRLCCTPRFDLAQLGDIAKFLQVFVNGADALEELHIRIVIEKEMYRKTGQMFYNYLHSYRPSLKLLFSWKLINEYFDHQHRSMVS